MTGVFFCSSHGQITYRQHYFEEDTKTSLTKHIKKWQIAILCLNVILLLLLLL